MCKHGIDTYTEVSKVLFINEIKTFRVSRRITEQSFYVQSRSQILRQFSRQRLLSSQQFKHSTDKHSSRKCCTRNFPDFSSGEIPRIPEVH